MNFRALIAILALLALAGAAWWQYGPDLNLSNIRLPGRSSAFETEVTSIDVAADGQLVADQQDVTSDLVQEFIDHYQRAVSKNDDQAAQDARQLLSWRAHTVVDRDKSLVEGLKRLTRGLEAPRDIEVSTSRRVGEGFAEVKTVWVYPTERLERYFYIIIEEGAWRIDSIQSIPQ